MKKAVGVAHHFGSSGRFQVLMQPLATSSQRAIRSCPASVVFASGVLLGAAVRGGPSTHKDHRTAVAVIAEGMAMNPKQDSVALAIEGSELLPEQIEKAWPIQRWKSGSAREVSTCLAFIEVHQASHTASIFPPSTRCVSAVSARNRMSRFGTSEKCRSASPRSAHRGRADALALSAKRRDRPISDIAL
jgi:hypothetical protein